MPIYRKIKVKKFQIQSTAGEIIYPIIAEYFDEDETVFTWECALVLSTYIVSRRYEFLNKNILEIGCGNGLVSITAALIGATNITMTDRAQIEAPMMYELMKYNVLLNQLTSNQISIVSIIQYEYCKWKIYFEYIVYMYH